MSGTPRLGITFLSAGQAQKEFTVNEAFQTFDVLVSGAVEEGPRAAPPSSSALGAAYIVGLSPSGAWAGKAQSVAAFTSGGWRFVLPVEGMTIYVKSTGSFATYRLGGWEFGLVRGSCLMVDGQQVVGSRQGPIASAVGGSTVDVQARDSISQILSAMRQHGLIES